MRTLHGAREIVRRYTTDPTALGTEAASEERLGCSLAAHRRFLREATLVDLRRWAASWAADGGPPPAG